MEYNKTMISVFLLAIINMVLAIFPHLMVKPFWVMHTDSLKYATLFELLYSAFVLPILLLKISKIFNRRLEFEYYIFSVLLMIVSIFVSMYFYYKNYADMTGLGNDPDPGTKWLVIIDLILGLLIIGIGVGVKYYRDKKSKM